MLSGKLFSRWPITKSKLLNGTETSLRRTLISNKTVTCVKERIVGKSEKKNTKEGEREGGREGGGGVDRNWQNSVYSHFYTNPQPQNDNNNKTNISRQYTRAVVFITPGRSLIKWMFLLIFSCKTAKMRPGRVLHFSNSYSNSELVLDWWHQDKFIVFVF